MSFTFLLEKLLAALITSVGPVLIEVIIKWIQGLDEKEVKEVAKAVAAAIEKSQAA